MEGVAEGHFAVFVVVAVAFAVGGDVGELGSGGVGAETAEEAFAEGFAAVEQAFKGDGAGAGAVVEEDGDGAAAVERDAVGVGGVDGGVGGGGPGSIGSLGRGCGSWRCRTLACGCAFVPDDRVHFWRRCGGGDPADVLALVGGEDGELDAFLGHEVEDLAIDGGFGEPHAFGFAAEAMLEVGDAPADLGAGVALGGEGHDDVVVDLGDSGAVAAVASGGVEVGIEDHAVAAVGFFLEPGEQGGTEVEAHAAVVVEDADDLVAGVGDARGAVGGVALGGDAFVPVVVGGGGLLELDGFEPGVFTRRLVEVAVDADEADVGGGGGGGLVRHGWFSGWYWMGVVVRCQNQTDQGTALG